MESTETFEHAGYTVSIYYDRHAEDPREWDNLGTMACWHRSYNLGDGRLRDTIGRDDFSDVRTIVRYLQFTQRAEVILLGLIDHSGISMYVGGGAHACDPGGWDSGTVGIIYATRETIISEYGDDSPTSREMARKCMIGEVETYDQFLIGDVYGYIVSDKDGTEVDSLWGLFGFDHAVSDAKDAAEHAA